MARRFFSWLLVSFSLVSLVLLSPPRSASADLIGTAPVSESGAAPGAADRDAVARSLADAGLSQPEISSRLDQLAPEDLAGLAHNPQQVQMAGASLAVISIWAAVVLFVVVIVWLETVNQKQKKEVVK